MRAARCVLTMLNILRTCGRAPLANSAEDESAKARAPRVGLNRPNSALLGKDEGSDQ